MTKKRQIDLIRDSGGAVEIGNELEGAIVDIFEFEGKLIVIKEKAIYEFLLADKIDPERKNINLPAGIQRKIMSQGADSEMVSRTFLTARKLFKSEFFPDTINIKKSQALNMELFLELSALDEAIHTYSEIEKKVIDDFSAQSKRNTSFKIPSISDVITRCKTIFQKADHIEQILMEINILFYPNSGLKKQSHFATFYEIIKKSYGEDDMFCCFIKDSLKFLELLRAFRNCLDHRLTNVKVYDFELLSNSDLLSPSIEIDYREIKLERESLSSLFPRIKTNLVLFIENSIAYLSDKNVNTSGLPKSVRLIPENYRSNRYIRFGFWSPLGNRGFFHQ